MTNVSTQEADLLETLGFIIPIPAQMRERVNQESIIEKFNRKQFLLVPGETARKFYFIREGFLRAYFIDEDGKECTSWFTSKGDFIFSVYSFFNQKPSYEYIEVLQDSVLQSLTWRQLNNYYADFEIGKLFGRIVIQKYLLSEERAIFLRKPNPEMKYNFLLKIHPDIEQKTTLTNIATYIGVTRETLSRLRSKKLRQSQTTRNLPPSIYTIH